MIDWSAFLIVAGSSLLATLVLVGLFSLGIRLLTTGGRIPLGEPLEFTGAITVQSPKRSAKVARRARKAALANPLTDRQKNAAITGGYACFVLCASAVLYGVYLIIPAFHT